MKFIYVGILSISFFGSLFSMDKLMPWRKKETTIHDIIIDKECAGFLVKFLAEIPSKDTISYDDFLRLALEVISFEKATMPLNISPDELKKLDIDLNKIKRQLLYIYINNELTKEQKIKKTVSIITKRIAIPINTFFKDKFKDITGVTGDIINISKLEDALTKLLTLNVYIDSEVHNIINTAQVEKVLGLEESSFGLSSALELINPNKLYELRACSFVCLSICMLWALSKYSDLNLTPSFYIIITSMIISGLLYNKTANSIQKQEEESKELTKSILNTMKSTNSKLSIKKTN